MQATKRRQRAGLTAMAVLMGALLAAGGGCQGDGPALAAQEGRGEPVDLRDAFGEEAVTGTYRMAAGPLEGEDVAFSIPAVASGQDEAVMTVEGVREMTWRRDEQGAVMILETTDHLEQVRVVYEPALMVVPARMRVGEVRQQEVEMNVYRLDDGSRRAGGSGTIEVELISAGRFDTPMGRVEGFHVRERHDLHLSLARVNVQVDTIYGRDMGPVRKSTLRRTRALGLFASEEREVLERVE